MNPYILEPGYLSFYKGFWDEEGKTFQHGTSADVIESCLRRCKDETLLSRDCRNACFEYPSQGMNYIQNCVGSVRCLPHDTDCIELKREEIARCFKEQCSPVYSEDCENIDRYFNLYVQNQKNLSDRFFANKDPVQNYYHPVMFLIIVIILLFLFMRK